VKSFDSLDMAEISPLAVRAALRDLGWTEHPSNLAASTLWTPVAKQRGTDVVLVPNDPSYDDYAPRLLEAIRTLARELDETINEVADRLVTVASDVVRFRSSRDTAADGSISLADGLDLLDGIKAALVASAKSSEEHRAYFGNAYWKQAKQFLERTRLGQTEHGSYVVKVLSRATNEGNLAEEQQYLVPGMVSHQRAVTFTLMRSLSATESAVAQFSRSGSIDVFYDAVSAGLSSDLCEAVGRMVRSDSSNVGVSAEWSPLAPVSEDVPSGSTFKSSDREILKIAVNSLRESELYPDITVTGWVEALARSESGSGPGTVTIVSDGRVSVSRGTRVRIALQSEAYGMAIAAHEAGDRVEFRGDLTREGNRYWLQNAVMRNK